jgi:hypothetical protein
MGWKLTEWLYKYVFLLILYVFIRFFDQLKIAPSIPDDSTAAKKLNKLLFSSEEAPESFINYEIIDLLRPLSNFTLIPITTHSGRP